MEIDMKKEKIKISYNKTLKLANVLIREVGLEENKSIEKEFFQMENYIKNKGVHPIGPFIQYTDIEGSDVDINLTVKLMRQANTFIHNVEAPYKRNQ